MDRGWAGAMRNGAAGVHATWGMNLGGGGDLSVHSPAREGAKKRPAARTAESVVRSHDRGGRCSVRLGTFCVRSSRLILRLRR